MSLKTLSPSGRHWHRRVWRNSQRSRGPCSRREHLLRQEGKWEAETWREEGPANEEEQIRRSYEEGVVWGKGEVTWAGGEVTRSDEVKWPEWLETRCNRGDSTATQRQQLLMMDSFIFRSLFLFPQLPNKERTNMFIFASMQQGGSSTTKVPNVKGNLFVDTMWLHSS